ncbi:MAG: hypothetical protein SAJ37_08265, partial [Oscillatoria sp. PMC 1068.18]|nr:hypothetical protein [Oscillatoria sp. PMC 1068.18]
MSPNQAETNFSKFAIFRISPLIRLTLLSLYIALTIPLPFLAKVVASPIPPALLWLGISIGFILLFGALSERVILTNEQIKVTYPLWFPKFLRKGWELNWSEIKDLKMRTTGQGGLVYYFTSNAQEKAYLLPMRVVGFARLLKLVETQTAIDTSDIRPLSQPWMYLILLVFTIFLLLVDTWAIVNA